MRLKHRLSLAVTGVTAAALLACFAVVVMLVRRDELGELDRALLDQAHTIAFASGLKDPLQPLVLDGAGEIPEIPSPSRRYVAVYDEGGALVAATRTFGGEAPQLPALGPLSADDAVVVDLAVGSLELRGVVILAGDGKRRLLYAMSRRAVDQDMRFLSKVFSVLFVAATSVTALVARFLGARLARDVDAIATVARAVEAGDRTARVAGAARGSLETYALGRDLDHMIERLDALVAAQQKFISHAAHELRSPLATLRGELQLALRRPRSVEEYRVAIEDALEQVEQLAALAEDLLVLARVQRDPAVARCALSEALADALHMASGPAGARRVRFVREGPELAELHVRGARPDVARAVRNLLDNAVAHSPEEGAVTLGVHLEPARVRLSIEDEGGGVSPEDAPHVFAPFFRGAKDQSDATGTGLGLAIVREIARAHGGDVRLEPSPRRGARFVLELPLS